MHIVRTIEAAQEDTDDPQWWWQRIFGEAISQTEGDIDPIKKVI